MYVGLHYRIDTVLIHGCMYSCLILRKKSMAGFTSLLVYQFIWLCWDEVLEYTRLL